MSTLAPAGKAAVHYPDSDGQPMADNTIQYRWIAILKWNAEALFRSDPNVFVAGDHLIYPVEGDPTIRQAPDVYVAFGPRKGDRGSYKVFEEGGVFPQVVFEVWSPNNRYEQMRRKFDFYEQYGAEEYYIVYPEFPAYLEGWLRKEGKLVPVAEMNGHTSPRLGFRFQLAEGDLTIHGPDGRPLRDPVEIIEETERVERQRVEAEQARDAERDRAARLAAKLRELGGDPDAV